MNVVGDLASGSGERTVTWTVTAAPQARAVSVPYSVTVTTPGAPPKTVSRTLAIPASSATSSNANVVALGDSYSSGEGASYRGEGTYDRGTDTRDNRCHRASTAWPRLLSVPQDRHLACSGATVGSVVVSGGNDDSRTSQISRLRTIEAGLAQRGQHVDTVTLTIGGNDIGFAGIIGDCYKNNNCLAGFMLTERPRLEVLRRSVSFAVDAIKQAAPRAQIKLIGYPRIFPRSDQPTVNCGWLTPVERDRANFLAADLDATFERLQDSRVQFVSVISALEGHELCHGPAGSCR